ncbi:hypothetical protein COY90_02010 [Candidatus Roizmanbacteria bacterium CG_4_10_14_0_8_um_filter_39_9]|uniref:Uncharacterized protein n=1 Tax=Candidatus Roizmanbacteria bacterium CG_4_10_14_0_8_um_filter_39_9 TaxID=1974829 RepID=A0A2M7QE36_9BACT|nr:MAG: hypothetical protein COY90_02010 [Candidatus Roizmanbacteria bacterium CG_4_10_14_0_8_um_filter_39_9]
MTSQIKIIAVVVFITAITIISASPKTVSAYTIGPVDVSVSAYIGIPAPTPGAKDGRFSLFGYSSPHAKVKVNNPGMYSDTEADDTGYFEFTRLFTSRVIEDICLIAQDTDNRNTTPVCIPPIPSTENASIGPVVMPPTLSINGGSFFTGDTITMSGQTTPDTTIKLSMFTVDSNTKLKASLGPMFSPVYAATLPKQDLKVSKNGKFTYSPPSDDPQYFRSFAQTMFQSALSPRSIMLNFDILPFWFITIKFFFGLWDAMKKHIVEIVLLAQTLLLFYLLYRHFFRPHAIARSRALMLRSHNFPQMISHTLQIIPHELVKIN